MPTPPLTNIVLPPADPLVGINTRLRFAVNRLVTQVPTALRSVLERYIPAMNANLSYQGTSAFPQSLKPMLHRPERTSVQSRGDVLCFHIGSAILAYYEKDADLMEKRVKLLENVADAGYQNCRVEGTVAKGYVLGVPLIAGKKKLSVPVAKKV